MKNRLFLFLLAAPLLAFSLAGVRVYYLINIWTYQGPDTVFTLNPGEVFSTINTRLYSKGLIPSKKLFYRYSKFKNYLTKFKAGSFKIKSQSTMLDVIDSLLFRPGITVSVTFPEGKNIFEIANLLQKANILKAKEFLKWAKDPQLAKSLNIPGETVEGYLFPETYYFSPNSSAKSIIKAMVKLFNKNFRTLANSSQKLTKHQIVTLASIVEKETGASSERKTISGVFHNRLRKNMRLQSDPTTIYGIYERFNGNLQKKHLRQKTPYNTYKIKGLPKGPISNPGLKSLEAVISPEKHQYLYFVSKNDGTHIFSKNYREHVQAVKKWQKTSQNRRGKSWRNLVQKKN